MHLNTLSCSVDIHFNYCSKKLYLQRGFQVNNNIEETVKSYKTTTAELVQSSQVISDNPLLSHFFLGTRRESSFEILEC